MADKNEQQTGDLSLQHQGDHHTAKIAVDPTTNKIAAGAIYNFSANSGAMLQVVDGKVEGSIAHSGDTHSLHLTAGSDGKFDGTFTDTNRGIEVGFKAGVATLAKGTIPEGGIKINGDHHSLSLQSDAQGKLNGVIESSNVANGTFRLQVADGQVSGQVVCKGDSHETAFSLGPGGSWGASVALGSGDKKLTFSFEKGRGGEVKGAAGLKLKF